MGNQLQVKVCGMRDENNINALLSLSIDYIGFIFYEESKRYVERLNTSIINHKSVKKVGVFVNSSTDFIGDKIKEYQLDIVQLHGEEKAEQCKIIRELPITVWKAFGVDQNFDFHVLDQYKDTVDSFLFDTKSVQHGGTGQTFDWSILQRYQGSTPYFLSGGLSLDNLPDALHIEDERLLGFDLNSKFEIEPGVKNIDLVNKALQLIKDE